MMKEFEGRTEQEAIAKAVEELHIEREDFDVEIVEPVRKGLFKKSNVKIRIHFEDENDVPEESYDVQSTQDEEELDAPINSDLEDKLLLFVATILEKMEIGRASCRERV